MAMERSGVRARITYSSENINVKEGYREHKLWRITKPIQEESGSKSEEIRVRLFLLTLKKISLHKVENRNML